MTPEHAARRYRQIADLETKLQVTEAKLLKAKAYIKDVQAEYEGIYTEIRAAARNEGELPLIDMMEDLAPAPALADRKVN